MSPEKDRPMLLRQSPMVVRTERFASSEIVSLMSWHRNDSAEIIRYRDLRPGQMASQEDWTKFNAK